MGTLFVLGFDPVMRIKCKNGMVRVEEDDTQTMQSNKPLDVLRDVTRYKAPKLPGLPPFTGGLVGYFSYAMIGYAEPVLKLQKGSDYDFDLMLFDKVIAYDHLKQKICIIANMRSGNVMENYGRAVSEIEKIVRIIRDRQPLPIGDADAKPLFTSNVTEEKFCEMVEKSKDYIRNGDIFQAVLSRRFESAYKGSLVSAYRVLRTTTLRRIWCICALTI